LAWGVALTGVQCNLPHVVARRQGRIE
jgi:hypothetical protein